jgi:5-methylcytosine-specific restriction endonuclease McrA
VRSTPEWQGKTDDSAIPVRVKLRVHAKAEGCCAKCGVEATTGQYDHAISLILGGENRESNLQFLCVPCHKAKTKARREAQGEGRARPSSTHRPEGPSGICQEGCPHQAHSLV